MGTINSDAILAKAAIVLNDTAYERWTAPELLGWLNDGQRAIVIHKPNACVKNVSVQLVAGTKQTIPADGVQLIDIPRNMGAAGATPGAVVRLTGRANLDAYVPNWHSSTPSAVVKHFMFNALDPKHFYVYPPQPATSMGYVEAIYGATPVDVTTGTAISLDDIYETPLLDYVLYRAFSKDTEFAPDPTRAAAHQQAFLAAVGGKAQAEAGVNPNVTAPAKATQTG